MFISRLSAQAAGEEVVLEIMEVTVAEEEVVVVPFHGVSMTHLLCLPR